MYDFQYDVKRKEDGGKDNPNCQYDPSHYPRYASYISKEHNRPPSFGVVACGYISECQPPCTTSQLCRYENLLVASARCASFCTLAYLGGWLVLA
jgi:hypothetical protein